MKCYTHTSILLIILLYTALVNAEEVADLSYQKEMEAARQSLKHHHGNITTLSLMVERFEYQTNEGRPIFAWFAQGWWGTDFNKLWVKSEGEYDYDSSEFEESEIQILYNHPIATFWDMQAGIRYDNQPKPARTFATFGFQGTAPYWFEIDATGFISDQGDFSVRLESEYELHITQYLILQPRIELNLSFSEDHAINIGSGLNTAEAGLRMHYALTQTLTPYLGMHWNKSFGDTADFIRADREATEQLSFIFGVKFFF